MERRRENDKNLHYIRFTEADMGLAVKMIENLQMTLDLMYYLMRRGDERTFVITLIETKLEDASVILTKEKRATDLFYEIDAEKGVYVVVCQDTKVDGGYHFANRLMERLKEAGDDRSYIIDMEVTNTNHEKADIVFRLIELLIKAKGLHQGGEILYKSLN